MSFDYGNVRAYFKSNSYYVRAVRGGQAVSLDNLVVGSLDVMDSGSLDDTLTDATSYTDNGDGTVTDTSTGLMWQQAGSCLLYTSDAADE